jgi:glycosyltransferase 2 family protein
LRVTRPGLSRLMLVAARAVAMAEMGAPIRKALLFGFKLAITCGCFWYLLRQINVGDLFREAANLNRLWFAPAIIVIMAQILLVALRWAWITDALEPQLPRTPRGAMVAITMIANFFAQILPNVMSDAIRIWMLSQIRTGWRRGLAGVVIDRGVGVGVLLAIGFVSLLNASAFTTLAGYRQTVLLIFGTLLVGGVGGLICARFYAPILGRHRITRWIAEFALASRQVLIESPEAVSIVVIGFVIHFLAIACIWSLGQAFSTSLGLIEAAVLFTVMVAIAIIPISISGWGLRELAVTAFLNAHGMPAQRALLFSICYGLTLVAAALPGAVVLIVYSPRKLRCPPVPMT